jgi:hypothetical protein
MTLLLTPIGNRTLELWRALARITLSSDLTIRLTTLSLGTIFTSAFATIAIFTVSQNAIQMMPKSADVEACLAQVNRAISFEITTALSFHLKE